MNQSNLIPPSVHRTLYTFWDVLFQLMALMAPSLPMRIKQKQKNTKDLSFWVVYPSLPSGPASGDEKLSRSNLHPTGVLQWTLESQVPNQASTNQIHSFALRGFEKIPGSYIGHSITNPKNNALLYRKIYQKYHRFALLDPSHMGNSMTPVKV